MKNKDIASFFHKWRGDIEKTVEWYKVRVIALSRRLVWEREIQRKNRSNYAAAIDVRSNTRREY